MTTMELIEKGIGHNCLSDAYALGRAEAIDEYKYNVELFKEIFLEELERQAIDREEIFMYRDICSMAWNKYLEQLKEKNMESRFKRGDVIAEKNWIGQTSQFVVLDTVYPPHIYIYSQSGYIATLSREQEHHYIKIGHIDLKPLWERIKEQK